jgi:uncharacterized membrane protein
MPALNTQQIKVRRWVLACWAGVFAVTCAWQLQAALDVSGMIWAAVLTLPLLITLPGLLRGDRYTHSWATLCVLPYFIVGITEAVANAQARNWALLLLGMSLLWFFALLAFLRVSTPVINPGESGN